MILPSCSQRHGIPRGVKGLEDDIVQGVQPDSEAWAAAVVLQEEAYGTVIGFTDRGFPDQWGILHAGGQWWWRSMLCR